MNGVNSLHLKRYQYNCTATDISCVITIFGSIYQMHYLWLKSSHPLICLDSQNKKSIHLLSLYPLYPYPGRQHPAFTLIICTLCILDWSLILSVFPLVVISLGLNTFSLMLFSFHSILPGYWNLFVHVIVKYVSMMCVCLCVGVRVCIDVYLVSVCKICKEIQF